MAVICIFTLWLAEQKTSFSQFSISKLDLKCNFVRSQVQQNMFSVIYARVELKLFDGLLMLSLIDTASIPP